MVENTVFELELSGLSSFRNRRRISDATMHRMGSHLVRPVYGGRWVSVSRTLTLMPCRATYELDRYVFLPGYKVKL